MHMHSFVRRAAQGLVLSAFLGLGLSVAQAAEPTLNEIYATAQAGKLDEAQVMVQQVLVTHPNSAKAHFVRSELYARQGDNARARESLASAEKLAPGLPFAKPEAVQALRARLSAAPSAAGSAGSGNKAYSASPTAPSSPAMSWGLPLLLAGGVIVLGYVMFRRRVPQPGYGQTYSNPVNPTGPQGYGMGGGAQPYAPNGYGPGGYAPQAGSGLGGRIMGGVATGLAVGAGVMAAEAIGRNLMGGHHGNSDALDGAAGSQQLDRSASNYDMGGNDFGVNDASSWDDGGSGGGGGGDWDT